MMATVAPVQERTKPKKVGDPENLNEEEESMSQKVPTIRTQTGKVQQQLKQC